MYLGSSNYEGIEEHENVPHITAPPTEEDPLLVALLDQWGWQRPRINGDSIFGRIGVVVLRMAAKRGVVVVRAKQCWTKLFNSYDPGVQPYVRTSSKCADANNNKITQDRNFAARSCIVGQDTVGTKVNQQTS